MTLRRLDRVLADRRVTPIVTVGRPFMPTVARVVATQDDSSVADGWVIAETRAGFEWDGELLRAAEVIVAKLRAPAIAPMVEMSNERDDCRDRSRHDQLRDRRLSRWLSGSAGATPAAT